MADHLTIQQLLAVMRTARSNWDALVAEAGEARLTEPGVEGDWSLKDIIAHITYFETWAADNVMAFRRGDPRPQSEYKGLEMDERNARRFAEMLREFSKETQFIVVTHNRATMESADVLYGVTLDADGTSKILSMKMEK